MPVAYKNGTDRMAIIKVIGDPRLAWHTPRHSITRAHAIYRLARVSQVCTGLKKGEDGRVRGLPLMAVPNRGWPGQARP
jgi:hypothetical protein